MATILLLALRIGGALAGSLLWYWRLPHPIRQAADARTRDHIERDLWPLDVEAHA